MVDGSRRCSYMGEVGRRRLLGKWVYRRRTHTSAIICGRDRAYGQLRQVRVTQKELEKYPEIEHDVWHRMPTPNSTRLQELQMRAVEVLSPREPGPPRGLGGDSIYSERLGSIGSGEFGQTATQMMMQRQRDRDLLVAVQMAEENFYKESDTMRIAFTTPEGEAIHAALLYCLGDPELAATVFGGKQGIKAAERAEKKVSKGITIDAQKLEDRKAAVQVDKDGVPSSQSDVEIPF